MASLSFSPINSSQQRIILAHIDAVVSVRLGPTRGLGKSQPACFNRQVAMYLASRLGRWSTMVIGRFCGGRDHSTVVHSIQRIEAMREIDPNLDVLLCDLKSRIGVADEGMEQAPQSVFLASSPATKQSELRLLANEITAQLRAVLREELRYTQHGDCPDACEESQLQLRSARRRHHFRITNLCAELLYTLPRNEAARAADATLGR